MVAKNNSGHKRFFCPLCGKPLSRIDTLRRHIENTHQVNANLFIGPKGTPLEDGERMIDEAFDYGEAMLKQMIASLTKRPRLSAPIITEGGLKEEAWMLLLSDLHYGLLVRPVEVGGLSIYNAEVAAERLKYLLNTIVRLLEYHPNKPKRLVINFMGDLIENAIMRHNQYASVEFGIISQVTLVTELLVDFVQALSAHFPIIECYGVYGNHGRVTKGKTDSHPSDNFDRLIYWALKERISGWKGVSLESTESDHQLIRINGWKFWSEHGDTVRAWAGIPFYGSKREKANIAALLATFQEQADYMLLAHHHTSAEFEGIYMNGSFVGGDLYSIGQLRRMTLPRQKLMGINKKHGVVWTRDLQLIDDPRNLQIEIYGDDEE